MSLTVRGPGMSVASLHASQARYERSTARLSSGLRINSAADDAAGLSISERLRSLAGGSAFAMRNVHDGINMVQTAEGGLEAITSMLQRARDLAVQGASTGSMSSTAREAIAAEARQLVLEIDRVARSTGSQGLQLLDGSRPGGFTFQIGADADDTLTVPSKDVRATTLGLLGSTGAAATTMTTMTPTPVTTWESQSAYFSTYTQSKTSGGGRSFTFAVDGVLVDTVKVVAGTYDAAGLAAAFRAELAGSPFTVTTEYDGAGRGRVVVGLADGSSTSSVTVGGADAGLAPLSFTSQGTTTTVDVPVTTTTAAVAPTAALVDLLTAGSQDAILLVDSALTKVLEARSELGAVQNRMGHRLSVLASSGENLAAARSRIADADMAHEWAGLVRAQVLAQAGSALQSQAVAGGQRVVQLLGSL